ncbi:MAG: efflux RND transporter periplasmic adaptor subunit [Methyloprofundus sp.]|nr:efflux RND transporter periplasmic adaptor subunit [Methyloprofundus sp.]
MKVLLMLIIFLNSVGLMADEKIKLSSIQLYTLGIKLGKLTAIKSVPLIDAPAKVIIPPDNEYIVSTSHAGLINQIKVTLDDKVSKGQVLATINSPELLALQRDHLKSVNGLILAKADYRREKKLFTEGLIAERRWRKTEARYNVFLSEVYETRQLLEISGISTEAIKSLEKTHRLSSEVKILAPISGVVLQQMVTVGERIVAMAPLFRVVNFKTLWFEISVPQQRIQHVQIGDKVTLANTQVSASIFLLGKQVVENNQSVLVRAAIETGQDFVRPGQAVSVKIRPSSSTPLFRVRNSALAEYKGVNYVFLRTQSGFAAKPIQIISKERKKVIISGDLKEQNEIAIRGAVALKANFLDLIEKN